MNFGLTFDELLKVETKTLGLTIKCVWVKCEI